MESIKCGTAEEVAQMSGRAPWPVTYDCTLRCEDLWTEQCRRADEIAPLQGPARFAAMLDCPGCNKQKEEIVGKETLDLLKSEPVNILEGLQAPPPALEANNVKSKLICKKTDMMGRCPILNANMSRRDCGNKRQMAKRKNSFYHKICTTCGGASFVFLPPGAAVEKTRLNIARRPMLYVRHCPALGRPISLANCGRKIKHLKCERPGCGAKGLAPPGFIRTDKPAAGLDVRTWLRPQVVPGAGNGEGEETPASPATECIAPSEPVMELLKEWPELLGPLRKLARRHFRQPGEQIAALVAAACGIKGAEAADEAKL